MLILGKYSCEYRDYETSWSKQLQRHVESVHDGVHYSCDECDYKAKWKADVKRHRGSKHEEFSIYVISATTKLQQKIV